MARNHAAPEVLDSEDLRERIAYLDPRGPTLHRLEGRLGRHERRYWYVTQQEHWLGWLREQDGPGAYGRKGLGRKSAEQVYNRINCAPMLVWLAEAVRVPQPDLKRACRAVVAAPDVGSAQCAAFRAVVPWSVIDARLRRRDPRPPYRR